jgi:hypothetical protein
MTAISNRNPKSLFADKKRLQQLVAEQNALIGLVRDPTATAAESRAMILAEGVRPEENLFSCGIISARNEE